MYQLAFFVAILLARDEQFFCPAGDREMGPIIAESFARVLVQAADHWVIGEYVAVSEYCRTHGGQHNLFSIVLFRIELMNSE